MRYSQLFGKTSATIPHDADSANARFLTQAGFVSKLAAGVYNYLPLGLRVLRKINDIIREEMNAAGGQELLMPSLHPVELWETTGRNRTWDTLFRTKGAGGKDFVLGPSHEETVTPLAASFVKSYKDLPFAVYQIQTKFRNEPRAKSGVLRGREFGMKDMYSFHRDEKDLDAYYERMQEAYMNVYRRLGLTAYMVTASGGAFSDQLSHEFSVSTPAGEDTIILCPTCGIAQNLEIAEGQVPDGSASGDAKAANKEKELPMKEVPIKRGLTIEENAKAHNVPSWKILKTVVYRVTGHQSDDKDGKSTDGFLGVVIRGDLQVNEHKLTRYLKKNIRAATLEELKELGLVRGFISPVGLPKVKGGALHAAETKGGTSLPFIGDRSIEKVKNFVTGANKAETDLINVNLGRDFEVSDLIDLVSIEKGFHCPKCGGPLDEVKAIEAGNIFKLGTKYSSVCDLFYTDEEGKQKLVIMGCYGIGSTRLLGTIVEASHDDKGIIWPLSAAPYQVHLATLGPEENTRFTADSIYADLVQAGVEVLYDDRNESAGKKLNDADLIGIPLRLVISKRTLEKNGVEWKLRAEKEARTVPLSDLKTEISSLLSSASLAEVATS